MTRLLLSDEARYLDTVWKRKADGRLFRTLGVITDPAVIIEDTISGEKETHVLASPNLADRFVELRPVDQ